MDNAFIANGQLSYPAGQLFSGSKPTGQDGPSMAAMPMDPRGQKNPSVNGNPSFTTCRNLDSQRARHNSEPRATFAQSDFIAPGAFSSISKDDAYIFEGRGRGSKSSKSQAASQPPQSFNPLQLLDPKGAASSQSRPKSGSLARSSPSSNGDYKRASQEPEDQGMGNLIERIHGITQRDGRPQKRQKTTKTDEDEDDEERKAIFAGGGKGGEIGEYMREKRKEAQAASGPNGTVVDLTAGIVIVPYLSIRTNHHGR